jgi:pyruvate ferredoxin oxidoreductase gamma subunit
MIETRIHGRGGQGSLVLAQFLAIAALEDDKYGQAFPFLGGGGERRGKPIMAYFRLAQQPIRIRSRITEPDYVIVQDATIIGEIDVEEGLKNNGMILINTDRDPQALGISHPNFYTFSADSLAREILGKPIINTALLGCFARMTGLLSLEAILKAVRKKFPGELGEKNATVVMKSYDEFAKEIA